MNLSLLCILLVLFLSSGAFTAEHKSCSRFYLSQNEITVVRGRHSAEGAYSFREKLISKGIDPEAISFRLFYSKFLFVDMYLSYKGESVGHFKAIYNKDLRLFESHVSINNNFRGKGLGLLMYIALAKEVYRIYQTPLISSNGPSPDAQRVWNSIVQNGWGGQGNFLDGNRFYFYPKIAANKFNDISQFILDHKRGTR